jgi:hypothetical protein
MAFVGKLGRIPHSLAAYARVPAMARYAAQAPLPPPPVSQDWYSKIDYWPMLANDRYGDCTVVGVLHAIQQWRTYATGKLWTPADDLALHLYSLFGFDPARPAETDQGAVEIDVLDSWLKGFDLGGSLDTLAAYASVDVQQPDELRYGIAWFGSVYLGIDLPKSVDGPLADIEWDVPPMGLTGVGAKGSLGPHCVIAVGYDRDWIYIVTWGRLVRMSWPFWSAYGDEAYALLSADFSCLPGKTPANIPWADLVHEWERLKPSSLTA